MSQENVETLRRVYSDWGRGNLRAGTAVFAPDVVCTWQVPEGRIRCRGPQEIRENMRAFLEQWSEWRMEAGELASASPKITPLVIFPNGRRACRLVFSPSRSGPQVNRPDSPDRRRRLRFSIRRGAVATRRSSLRVKGLEVLTRSSGPGNP